MGSFNNQIPMLLPTQSVSMIQNIVAECQKDALYFQQFLPRNQRNYHQLLPSVMHRVRNDERTAKYTNAKMKAIANPETVPSLTSLPNIPQGPTLVAVSTVHESTESMPSKSQKRRSRAQKRKIQGPTRPPMTSANQLSKAQKRRLRRKNQKN